MITSAIEFELYELLLESMVEVAPGFKETLEKTKHPIAKVIIQSIDPQTNLLATEEDIKDVSAVYPGSEPDLIVVQKPGRPYNPNNNMKIGKFVKKISSTFSQDDVEKFVTAYKAASLEKSIDPAILKGEDIRKAYLHSSVSIMSPDFASNCMRKEECQDFLDMYVDNPDKINLVVQYDQNGKVLARALRWKTDQGEYVLDLVYAADAGWKSAIKNWADSQGYYRKAYDDNKPFHAVNFIHNGEEVEKKFKVTLNKSEYNYYPYLDTFSWMTSDGVLYNYRPSGVDFVNLKRADGTVEIHDYHWWNDIVADNFLQVQEFMEEFGIYEEDYDYNKDDNTVALYKGIRIVDNDVRRLPFKCSVIYGDVELVNTNLDDLSWMPEAVYGNVDISSNSTLSSLNGASRIIHGDFSATDCTLRSLQGGPEIVKGDYDVKDNELRSIEHLAKQISGDLDLRDQKSNAKFTETMIKKISKVKGRIFLGSSSI